MKVFTMICAATIAMFCSMNARAAMDTLKVHFSAPVAIGETVLPAGDWKIQIVRGSTSSSTMVLRSESGASAQTLVNRLNSSTADDHQTHVVLRHSGNNYQLEQIWFEDGSGFQVLGN